MTREEAIKILTETQVVYFAPNGKAKVQEAIDMAIEALSVPQTDLISRADAIEAVERIGSLDTDADREYARSIIDAVPEPKWIPCSERLPKEKQEVYVTVYFIEGDTGRAYGYMDGFGRWHLYSTVEGTLNSGYEVIAWMPLPKPYKGGDDK